MYKYWIVGLLALLAWAAPLAASEKGALPIVQLSFDEITVGEERYAPLLAVRVGEPASWRSGRLRVEIEVHALAASERGEPYVDASVVLRQRQGESWELLSDMRLGLKTDGSKATITRSELSGEGQSQGYAVAATLLDDMP